jgi:uncharacterized protein YegP (UPF0339 family)
MKFVVYKDSAGEWRWTLRARNGRKVADGAEGYRRQSSIIAMLVKINPQFPIIARD